MAWDQGPVLCQNLSRDPSREAHGMVPSQGPVLCQNLSRDPSREAHGMVLGGTWHGPKDPATRDQFSARTSPGTPPRDLPGGTWHGPKDQKFDSSQGEFTNHTIYPIPGEKDLSSTK